MPLPALLPSQLRFSLRSTWRLSSASSLSCTATDVTHCACDSRQDAVGSHLDFTNPATAVWWRAQVLDKLLSVGIGSTWNDNNEYRVEDESALCHGFGAPTQLRLVRPVQALLMVRCSLEAQRAYAPTLRPWLISRSGMPGTQRYAQTWSGDNYTSWHTLKHNVRMGLGLSLSGFFNTGHDVGGFAGPAPEPELFVRWVQNGCFHPRFTIHSWNTDLDGKPDGTCNEPWMFSDALPLVRAAIKMRYSLVPYLYQLVRRAASEHEPMLRPVWLDHEHDPKAWDAAEDDADAGTFLLGEALLIVSIVERGQRKRPAYLPDNGGRGWWNWHDGGEWYDGGQTVTLNAPLDRCPMLARGGSLVVLAEPAQSAATAHSRVRTLLAFPLPPAHAPTSVTLAWVEDDGITSDDPVTTGGERDRAVINCDLHCTPDLLRLCTRITLIGDGQSWRPSFQTINVRLPPTERRPLTLEQECWADSERCEDILFRVEGAGHE